jgi:hypothetical protein
MVSSLGYRLLGFFSSYTYESCIFSTCPLPQSTITNSHILFIAPQPDPWGSVHPVEKTRRDPQIYAHCLVPFLGRHVPHDHGGKVRRTRPI